MAKINYLFWKFLGIFLAAYFVLAWPLDSYGAAPLLMPGKKTLYQKVITHPGAARYASPGDQPQSPLVPFSVLYLYGRKLENGRPWLNCGGNTTGEDLFWLPAEVTSDWKQSLVLLFSPRGGRKPLIFFKTKEALVELANNPNISRNLDDLADEFTDYRLEERSAPEQFPVVAMEPDDEEGAVPYDHFYLMPIFSSDQQFESFKILEVGSIDPDLFPEGGVDREDYGGGISKPSPPPDRANNAIAFVIDTTISMGPYIEQCRELTRQIYDRIDGSGQGDNVALAVVAFRSSSIATPDIEYTTKVISPLRTAMDRYDFEDALSQVQEAKVSTHAYAEDSLAGLNTAIEKLDWEPYHGRVIFLLTDAGPLPLEDPFNSIPATPETIFEKARAKNIKIVPIHIKSPSGSHNHMSAERAYKSLSFEGGGKSNYFDIPAPSGVAGAEIFGSATDQILRSMEAEVFKQRDAPLGAIPKEKLSPIEQRASDLGTILGNSIRLDYLGSRNQARSPRVVKSFIPDMDLSSLDQTEPRNVRTVDVAVLLTKNQLSALARQLNIILTNAERVMSEQSEDFFRSILSASAQISRDPSQFSLTPNTRLADLGVLGEFLEDLPYKSKIMGMTEADWYNMSPGEQDSFVRSIKARLTAYDEYDKDVDNWAKFESRNDGEWLYRVPLTMLP